MPPAARLVGKTNGGGSSEFSLGKAGPTTQTGRGGVVRCTFQLPGLLCPALRFSTRADTQHIPANPFGRSPDCHTFGPPRKCPVTRKDMSGIVRSEHLRHGHETEDERHTTCVKRFYAREIKAGVACPADIASWPRAGTMLQPTGRPSATSIAAADRLHLSRKQPHSWKSEEMTSEMSGKPVPGYRNPRISGLYPDIDDTETIWVVSGGIPGASSANA